MKTLSRITGCALISFAVVLSEREFGSGVQALADEPTTLGTERAEYFSKVVLKTQDGKDVNFFDLVKGKIFIINLMYTRCDGKLCTRGIDNLVKLQKELSARHIDDVFIYSITLDPEHDTPEVLKEYAKEHGAHWTFLTGNLEDITQLRRRLGMFNSDPNKDADRTQHSGMIKIYNDANGKNEATSVLAKPYRILQMITRLRPPEPAEKK